jgi:hypothetical protein
MRPQLGPRGSRPRSRRRGAANTPRAVPSLRMTRLRGCGCQSSDGCCLTLPGGLPRLEHASHIPNPSHDDGHQRQDNRCEVPPSAPVSAGSGAAPRRSRCSARTARRASRLAGSRLLSPRQQDRGADRRAFQVLARLGVGDDLARPAVPGHSVSEVEGVAVSNRMGGGAGNSEVCLCRCNHLLVGDDLGLEQLADGGGGISHPASLIRR